MFRDLKMWWYKMYPKNCKHWETGRIQRAIICKFCNKQLGFKDNMGQTIYFNTYDHMLQEDI
jgi:hypothetical protein